MGPWTGAVKISAAGVHREFMEVKFAGKGNRSLFLSLYEIFNFSFYCKKFFPIFLKFILHHNIPYDNCLLQAQQGVLQACLAGIGRDEGSPTWKWRSRMKAKNPVLDYLTTAYLIGLFTAVGIAAAITTVLVLWPPLAYVASKFF